MAPVSGYFDLLQDKEKPESFNPTQSITREQFNALVYRAVTPVNEEYLEGYLGEEDPYTLQMGGETVFTAMSKQMDEYGFMSFENGALDATNINGSITRLEALHIIVKSQFASELNEFVNGPEYKKYKIGFADVKNGGNVAYKYGFMVKNKETKEIEPLAKWQQYVLQHMLNNPDKGMQEELYQVMVMADRLALLGDRATLSKWDEPLSRAESIQLMINTFIAKNRLYGYLSTVEYGKGVKSGASSVGIEANAGAGEVIDVGEGFLPKDDTVYENGVDIEDIDKHNEKVKEQLGDEIGSVESGLVDGVKAAGNDGNKTVKNENTDENKTETSEKPANNNGNNGAGGKTQQEIEREMVEQAMREAEKNAGSGGTVDGATGRPSGVIKETGKITGEGYEGLVNWH